MKLNQLESLKHAHIMMVDDDPIAIDAIELFLSEAGYSTFTSLTDSRRALAQIAATQPDALLLDLNMPNVGGLEILEQIQADRRLRHTPTLVLTASDEPATKLRCLELGATDFLAKPIDPSELVLRMRNTLFAKAYQDRLTFYDALTGLPNRKMFLQRLSASVGASEGERLSAVLHIDLDRFQKVNDTIGLVAADGLLKEVGGRLVECVRTSDVIGRVNSQPFHADVSRLGGDEFSILLSNSEGGEAAAQVARRVLKAFEAPFSVEGQEVFLTVSIGIAVFPHDAQEPDDLLRCAGSALAHAKESGRNNLQFYSSELNSESAKRLMLTNELRKALGREELVVWYQPKVDIASGAICGAEALVRWDHPELGMLWPDVFIPLAEEAGFIVELGEYVLRAAAHLHEQWRDTGVGFVPISVNVSAQQFDAPSFEATLRDVFANVGRGAICLELTETVVMRDPAASIRCLDAARELGAKVSVDDFGTGYSSLSYLKKLPIDELKIDRSFVCDIDTDENDRAIVTAIIALARSLGFSVVAEGVETEGHLAFLRSKGCDQYQGFLCSRAVPAAAFVDLLNRSGIADSDRG